MEEHVLEEHHRGAHIHAEHVLLPRHREETQLGQGVAQGTLGVWAAAEGVGVVGFQAPGQQLVEEHPADGVGLGGVPLWLDLIHHEDAPRGVLPDKGCALQGTHGLIEVPHPQGVPCRPAQQGLVGPQAEDRAHGAGPAAEEGLHGLGERLGRAAEELEVHVLPPQHPLAGGGANVAPGIIDEGLDHWIHQHGDVQVLVYRGPDAGGTYPLKEGGQGEGENLPLEDLSQRAQVRGGLPLLGPGEDNVVVLPGGAGGLAPVGRGMGDDVRAHDQVEVRVMEEGFELG